MITGFEEGDGDRVEENRWGLIVDRSTDGTLRSSWKWRSLLGDGIGNRWKGRLVTDPTVAIDHGAASQASAMLVCVGAARHGITIPARSWRTYRGSKRERDPPLPCR